MPTISIASPLPTPCSLYSSSSFPDHQDSYKFKYNNCFPYLFLHGQTPLIHHSAGPQPACAATSVVKGPPTLDPISQSQPNNRISALCRESRLEEAMGILHIMDQNGDSVDSNSYASLLQACTDTKSLAEGKEIHAHMLTNGLEQDEFLGAKLVGMYVMCGSMVDARLVFDKLFKQNVKSWNDMIRGYAINGPFEESLALYHQMQRAGIRPNNFTFPFVLKVCAALSDLSRGREIHGHIVRSGFLSDVYVMTALIDMYTKCGSTEIGRQLFDKMSARNVVSWNVIIAGYVHNADASEALALFCYMLMADVKPNSVTVLSVLRACALLGDLQQGKWIHAYIIRNGFEVDAHVGSALIDMYAKCRSVKMARQTFDRMPKSDVFSWTAMVAGYAQNGYANEALALFHQMQLAGVKPNSVTMVSVLPACAHLATLEQGKWIHAYIVRSGFESEISAENSLVAMYAKCGSIDLARCVFDKMHSRNVSSWNAMITGYAMHGYDREALTLFFEMQEAGLKPNHITFVCILSACSHAGLVDKGWQYFDCMSRDYSITPRMEHYACMVDLLGRAGHLDEAHDLIKNMPFEPGAAVWGALLGACRTHCNIQLGEHATKHLVELEPTNAGNYVLLSDIYAAAGKWDSVAKVRTMLKNRGLKKIQGCSWIEIKNEVHAFLVKDRTHPQLEKIYEMLDRLAGQMQEAGYILDMNLHDMEEENEYILCSHSEKLAIAFGLINTNPRTPIRITKNLRVCNNCHDATKIISKMVKREIIVRDVNRFHHFSNGFCSCGDYW